ncbi:MAG: DUF4215 domain-containing protein [Nannocystis sp.]|nr:DUF4215 domain-containing protein [Nannocystis sp.]
MTATPGGSTTGAGETSAALTEAGETSTTASTGGASTEGPGSSGSTDGLTGLTGDSGESTAGSEETGVGEGGCINGTQDCPCNALDTCNDGLTCDAGVCVPAALPVCGDGMLAGTEECDAGAENGDTKLCKADCTLQKCGDSFVGPGEGCDDGNQVDNDACSNACVPAACGDQVVQVGEACDDGNVNDLDACIACKAAACGDTFVQAGVEECDDGNVNSGDGCSAACKKEVPKCGGFFTTGWCPQVGTKDQSTRCESVSNNGKTCNNPFIKYGFVENGVPASHPGNDFNQWCQQLGFGSFSGQVSYGNRPCLAPQGKLFGCAQYDENVWHWCDWQDGPWYNQQLDHHMCNDGQEITSITCQ